MAYAIHRTEEDHENRLEQWDLQSIPELASRISATADMCVEMSEKVRFYLIIQKLYILIYVYIYLSVRAKA